MGNNIGELARLSENRHAMLRSRYGDHNYDLLNPLQKSFLLHPELYDNEGLYSQIRIEDISEEAGKPRLVVLDESFVLMRSTGLNGYVDRKISSYAGVVNFDRGNVQEHINGDGQTYFRMKRDDLIIDMVFSRDKI